MQNIMEILKSNGIEVPEDKVATINKAVSENYKTVSEVEKKILKLETERDSWKEKAELAEDTLKGFDGKDIDAITKERDEWKQKAEDAEKEYAAKEAKREFDDILKESIAEVKGKNEKAILANLDVESLMKSRNQREDIKKALEALKVAEDTSFMFVDEKQESLENNKARFTTSMNNQNGGGVATMTRKDIEAIKDTRERQKAIAENAHLYQK